MVLNIFRKLHVVLQHIFFENHFVTNPQPFCNEGELGPSAFWLPQPLRPIAMLSFSGRILRYTNNSDWMCDLGLIDSISHVLSSRPHFDCYFLGTHNFVTHHRICRFPGPVHPISNYCNRLQASTASTLWGELFTEKERLDFRLGRCDVA